MNADSAMGWLRLVLDLGKRLADAVHRRDYDRVARILPDHLRTSIERQLADDDARERFARRDDPTVPSVQLDPSRNGEGHQ